LAKEWYLATVRHGETDYNKENRYAGSIDIPLNENGRHDASQGAKYLRSIKFDVALVSPLQRAIETAILLTERSTTIIPCPYARERNYGILQGLTSADVEGIKPPIHFIKRGGDYHSLDPPHAETFEELRDRAISLYQHIIDHYKGQRILVVSHGVFLQQFHGLIRGKDWIEALESYTGNLELTNFHFKDETVVSEDHIHLATKKRSKW
jgi:probable phosphoglycerate mutase